MSLVLDAQTARSRFGDQSDPSQWTAIIPAAGKGSRLGYHLPKILYPIQGRPIAAYLIDLLRPFCSRLVFVLSPDGEAPVARELAHLFPDFKVAIQSEPRGMADAVQCARAQVATRHAVVVWGDQVALKPETIRLGMAAHQHRAGARVTIPTHMKRSPYIHFERDASGRVRRVLQAREAPIPHAVGENDAGIFFFETRALFETLESARSRGIGMGASTGEFNLLQVLPEFEDEKEGFCTLRVVSEEETLGINTPEEAAFISRVLGQGRAYDGN